MIYKDREKEGISKKKKSPFASQAEKAKAKLS
jgi:hypothetical protein